MIAPDASRTVMDLSILAKLESMMNGRFTYLTLTGYV
jgi:hypothetical protein